MTKTPCQKGTPEHMDLWTSDHAPDRRLAATFCVGCPIITQCGVEAMERKEAHGVFGGIDFSKNNALAGRRADTFARKQDDNRTRLEREREERAEFVRQVEELLNSGATAMDVCHSLEVTHGSAARRLYRAGRPDLARVLSRLRERKSGTCPDCGTATSDVGRRCVPCGHVARQPKWRESFMGRAS